MEQRFSMITLGVADLERSVAFYEKVIGWKALPSPRTIVFFNLSGFVLGLCPHADLAEDLNAVADDSGDFAYRGFTLSYFVRSKAEVDDIFSRLKDNGAAIIKKPEQLVWGGYHFYFSDLDSHCWRVLYTPNFTIEEDGRVWVKKKTE